MTTQNTISIPGILPSLVEEVKQLRDYEAERSDRQLQEKQAIESKRIAENRQALLDCLDKYAGSILRQLEISTGNPVIENSNSNWFYRFRVAHVIITLVTLQDPQINSTVGVHYEGCYFGDPETKWVDKVKLSYHLLNLVGLIVEEYQQYRLLAADLDRYNTLLEMGAIQTCRDIEFDKANLWTWPDRATLNLYKITRTKGGYYDSDRGEPYFQYEFAWSLSDRPDEKGYFDLLTLANSINTRRLKVAPNSVELFPVAKIEDVPVELMVSVNRGYEVAITSEISLHEAKWTEEQVLDYKRGIKDCDLDDLAEDDIHFVFLEHLPECPSEIPNLVVIRIKHIELGRSPCLGIQLAVEAIASSEKI